MVVFCMGDSISVSFFSYYMQNSGEGEKILHLLKKKQILPRLGNTILV